jgi:MFS family permease
MLRFVMERRRHVMTMQETLTAALFTRNEAGQTVVYPNGALGRGYILPNAETEQRMRRILMWMIISAGVVGGLGGQGMFMYFGRPSDWPMHAWVAALIALGVFAAAYRFIAAGLASGLAPVEARLSITDALRRQSESMPRWYLVLLVIISPIFAVGAVHGIIMGPSTGMRILSGIGAVLFGTTTVQAIYGLTRRHQ